MPRLTCKHTTACHALSPTGHDAAVHRLELGLWLGQLALPAIEMATSLLHWGAGAAPPIGHAQGSDVVTWRPAASPLRAARVLPTTASFPVLLLVAQLVLLVRRRLEHAAPFVIGRGRDVAATCRGEHATALTNSRAPETRLKLSLSPYIELLLATGFPDPVRGSGLSLPRRSLGAHLIQPETGGRRRGRRQQHDATGPTGRYRIRRPRSSAARSAPTSSLDPQTSAPNLASSQSAMNRPRSAAWPCCLRR